MTRIEETCLRRYWHDSLHCSKRCGLSEKELIVMDENVGCGVSDSCGVLLAVFIFRTECIFRSQPKHWPLQKSGNEFIILYRETQKLAFTVSVKTKMLLNVA